jgi:probable F420-dependent oxidoreductase
MKFTTMVAMVDPTYYVPLAQAAEEAGFDGIGLSDSICYPRESDSIYPYTPDGSREFIENKPFVEPLAATAAMGAVTSRIRFFTAVMKLPIRHPVLLAKQVTSVQALTGDRFDLGVGTSPWPEDYELVELPWAGRGRRFEECIDIIRRLATGEYVGYDGEFYHFPELKLNPPAPVRILIGGHSERNLERAARFADGWIPAGMMIDELAAAIRRLGELRKRFEREDQPFEIHALCPDGFSADGVRRLAELGVTHTMGGFSRFNPYGREPDTEPLQAKVDALRRYADDVIALSRA